MNLIGSSPLDVSTVLRSTAPPPAFNIYLIAYLSVKYTLVGRMHQMKINNEIRENKCDQVEIQQCLHYAILTERLNFMKSGYWNTTSTSPCILDPLVCVLELGNFSLYVVN